MFFARNSHLSELQKTALSGKYDKGFLLEGLSIDIDFPFGLVSILIFPI